MTTLPAPPMTDEALAARVLAGERALYAELLRRHNRRIYRVARSIVQDDGEAEDVLQDAYVRAYEHLGDFAGRSTWVTWITRIAVYEALARVRQRKRETTENAMPEQPSPVADPEQKAASGELAKLLESAVDALPVDFRTVFVLRDVEGLGVAETAESLEIKEETVKTRLHRARRLLREDVERRLGERVGAVFDFQATRCERVVGAVMRRLEGSGR